MPVLRIALLLALALVAAGCTTPYPPPRPDRLNKVDVPPPTRPVVVRSFWI